MSDERDVVERLHAAQAMIGDMCAESRPPKMSIPVDALRDEDVVITQALSDAIAEIDSLRAQLAQARAEVEALRKERDRAERWYSLDGEDEGWPSLDDIAEILRERIADEPDYLTNSGNEDGEFYIYETRVLDLGGSHYRLPDVGPLTLVANPEDRAAEGGGK